MNIVSIKIKFSYWDFNSDNFRISKKSVYEQLLEIDQEISKLEKKLYDLIMEDKNDGMSIEVNSSGTFHFIEIDLFLGEVGDTYDISYIIEFLSQFKIIERISYNNDLSNYQGYIYIKGTELVNHLVKLLNIHGINLKIIGKTTSKYERGASDFWEAYLLAIEKYNAIKPLIYLIYKFLEKYKEYTREIQFGTFNAQKLKENVANLIDESHYNLVMISFEKIEEDRYNVTFTTRYQKINVETDNTGKVLKFNTDKKTQTRL